jgi:predicted pyridoxine 5'-phosphate oxidase superfamily flavin-nucleotide-binding protein
MTVDEPPFHAGERAAQRLAGVPARIEEVGKRLLRDAMADQQREFFAQLPFVVLGAADVEGRLQATLLTGAAPCFVRSPDATRLTIDARPLSGDPLAGALQPGDAVGLLGIELPTRRRNRANVRVIASGDDGMTLQITQSFGNCPKYIPVASCARERTARRLGPHSARPLSMRAPPRWSAAPTRSSSPAERLAM